MYGYKLMRVTGGCIVIIELSSTNNMLSST
jgi:hypothetical protein